MKILRLPAITTALGVLLLAHLASAQTRAITFTTLYSFKGQGGDGAQPYAGLAVGNNARLYGTTVYGGSSAAGTVFELAPPVAAGGAWRETVLYSFAGGNDGANPYGGLVIGTNGSLYGTTAAGGTANAGTVFELAPPAAEGGIWKETILHDFGAIGDGADPQAGVVFGANGVLYGTTYDGGTPQPYPNCPGGCGTVFELSPPAAVGAMWTETVLYSFLGNGSIRGNPAAGVVIGQGGVLYGTTIYGGTDGGTVFALTPPDAAGGDWTETTIHSFLLDGSLPYGGLAVGKNGSLYGTTSGGNGSAFELVSPEWTESFYNFMEPGGIEPYAGLAIGADGALFGTTYTGGTLNPNCALLGCGTVFELTPPAAQNGAWFETVLHAFSGENSDGAEPYAALVFGANGVLYGTTMGGGASGWGTVFALVR
jgi:uncharacterized repeat protein (TIGR03803 family)